MKIATLLECKVEYLFETVIENEKSLCFSGRT
ncbi:hypothetical protein [Lactobacillus iners]